MRGAPPDRVRIQSEPNEGTTFKVYLSVANACARRSLLSPHRSPAVRGMRPPAESSRGDARDRRATRVALEARAPPRSRGPSDRAEQARAGVPASTPDRCARGG